MEALVRGEAKPQNERHNTCYGTPEGHAYHWLLQGGYYPYVFVRSQQVCGFASGAVVWTLVR